MVPSSGDFIRKAGPPLVVARDVEKTRLALPEFRRTYNDQWIMDCLGYRTPARARKDARRTVENAAW